LGALDRIDAELARLGGRRHHLSTSGPGLCELIILAAPLSHRSTAAPPGAAQAGRSSRLSAAADDEGQRRPGPSGPRIAEYPRWRVGQRTLSTPALPVAEQSGRRGLRDWCRRQAAAMAWTPPVAPFDGRRSSWRTIALTVPSGFALRRPNATFRRRRLAVGRVDPARIDARSWRAAPVARFLTDLSEQAGGCAASPRRDPRRPHVALGQTACSPDRGQRPVHLRDPVAEPPTTGGSVRAGPCSATSSKVLRFAAAVGSHSRLSA
jgi:hypothetical protein